MEFLSIEPFIPSGNNFEASKQLFQELGFTVTWDGGDYVGFEKDGCKFILQKYDQKEFAENLMLSVKVTDVSAFRNTMLEKKLPERFGISISQILNQPYGKEVNLIDIAGVCWHFIE
jgi:hypothetical protein